MLRRPPTALALDAGLSPETALERLRGSMSIVPSLLLTPTWGRKERFVGRVEGARIEMRVRHGTSNGLTRLFYGEVTPTAGGSRLSGEFRTLLWVVLILRGVWLALLVPTAVLLVELLASGRAAPRELLAGVSVPLATLAILLVVEIVGRRMGDADERRMRDHLERLFRGG